MNAFADAFAGANKIEEDPAVGDEGGDSGNEAKEGVVEKVGFAPNKIEGDEE